MAAVQFVDSTSAAGYTNSLVVTAPSGIQDGDLIIACGRSLATVTLPSGFTTIIERTSPTMHVGYKWASSESGNYTFTIETTQNSTAHLLVFRYCVGSGDPVNVTSNTTYTTSNTTVRAASMTTTTSGAQVWFGCINQSNPTLSVPAAFTAAETVTQGGNRSSTGYRLDELSAVWGETGTQDGTSDAASSTKHAIMVNLTGEGVIFTGLRVTRIVGP